MAPGQDDESKDSGFTAWTRIESTVLAAVRYNHAGHLLQLAFQSGRFYQYEGVPPAIFAELTKADSKGTFFNKHIRDCFRFTEIPPSPQGFD